MASYPLLHLRARVCIPLPRVQMFEDNERSMIANELQNHVLECIDHHHANHVLRKCVEVLAYERVSFVITNLQGNAEEVAKHVYGVYVCAHAGVCVYGMCAYGMCVCVVMVCLSALPTAYCLLPFPVSVRHCCLPDQEPSIA